jgi:RNA polymerase sigma factor (sigma-70 family)
MDMERTVADSLPDLLGLARAGDGEAFAMLVEPHLARALSTASLIVGGGADASDVVQEAMLSAWKGLPNLRDPHAFGPWFRRQVVRGAWKAARRARRTVPFDSSWADPVDRIERGLAERQLARSFDRLSADDRVVLTLHYHLGLPIQETALLMRLRAGTVKSRLHYALRRLHAAYDAEERA